MKRHWLPLLASALFSTSHCAFAELPERIDVSGLALGATATEAEQVIRKELPKAKVQFVEAPWAGGAKEKVGLYAESGGPTRKNAMAMWDLGPPDEFAAMFTHDGRVWFVSRLVRMEGEERLPYDDVVASITKKFGKPVDVELDTTPQIRPANRLNVFLWELLPSGAEPIHIDPHCQGSRTVLRPLKQAGISTNVVQYGHPRLNLPREFGPYCGTLVEFAIVRDPDGMSSYYRLQIIDVSLEYQAMLDEAAEVKRRNAETVEAARAKGMKPKF